MIEAWKKKKESWKITDKFALQVNNGKIQLS